MVTCRICGKEIRYITTAPSMGNNGIIPVETGLEELITENGRKVRGYRVHTCIMPERKDACHAYNGGECMNAFGCKPEKASALEKL